MIYVLGKRILNMLNHVIFPSENTNIDVSVFMFDLMMINMSSECEYDWYWKISDRIWSLWIVRFAHSPPSFIFWLGRLIFSVSINSHPDNIYVSNLLKVINCILLYDYKYPRFWLDKTLLHSPFLNVIITAQKCTRG